MKKLLIWMHDWGVIVVMVLLLINMMQNCSQSRRIDNNTKAIKINTVRIDSMVQTLKINYNKDELDLRLEILGYQVSKRMLYDNNAIIRRITRPDDQMNKYDERLDSLRGKLKK
jgi:hypothetical protein